MVDDEPVRTTHESTRVELTQSELERVTGGAIRDGTSNTIMVGEVLPRTRGIIGILIGL